MTDDDSIKKYYSERVGRVGEQDFLKQVGKTVDGREIKAEQFQLIVESIKTALQLEDEDSVLDVGCANGLITKAVSNYCKKITGCDLSPELIAIAKKYHYSTNITYRVCNARDITCSEFSKIYLYEVLQHFDFKSFGRLLESWANGVANQTIFVGSVPDAEKKFSFFDSLEKRRYYFKLLEVGEDHLGSWWYREHIEIMCQQRGLKAVIIDQDQLLPTASYRFDFLVRKPG